MSMRCEHPTARSGHVVSVPKSLDCEFVGDIRSYALSVVLRFQGPAGCLLSLQEYSVLDCLALLRGIDLRTG